jgi:2-keto-3-deoxy-L-rhamnonate aldolase RhmA
VYDTWIGRDHIEHGVLHIGWQLRQLVAPSVRQHDEPRALVEQARHAPVVILRVPHQHLVEPAEK